MTGLIGKMLDSRSRNQGERERRSTYVEVLRNLPDRGVVDDLRADGSRMIIYILPPRPETA